MICNKESVKMFEYSGGIGTDRSGELSCKAWRLAINKTHVRCVYSFFFILACSNLMGCLEFDPSEYVFECFSNLDCIEGYSCVPSAEFGVKICSPICQESYADCDRAVPGCETRLHTQTDCGFCGDVCGDSAICDAVNGAWFCLERCDPGLFFCETSSGPACIDTELNDNHCGGCGIVCGEGETCNQGNCVCDESRGWLECGTTSCVDPSSDPNHCGGCDVVCGEAQSCFEGTCVCNENFGNCDQVNELDRDCETSFIEDTAHCGGCDLACSTNGALGSDCVEGICVPECESAYGDCDGDHWNGCEEFLLSSSEHCGGCGITCEESFVCLAGKCVNDQMKIASGVGHHCLLNHDGRVFCWGFNEQSQLGLSDDPATFVDKTSGWVEMGAAIDVDAGAGHSCAVTEEGDVYCWGVGTHGQLGCPVGGCLEFEPTPNIVYGPRATKVVTGKGSFANFRSETGYTCTLTDTKRARCWGHNRYGQLGNGDHALSSPNDADTGVGSTVTEYVENSLGDTVDSITDICAGATHTCAIREFAPFQGERLRKAYCWGIGEEMILGFDEGLDTLYNGGLYSPHFSRAVESETGINLDLVASISCGGEQNCLIDESDGEPKIYCWGVSSDALGPNAPGSSQSRAVWVPLPDEEIPTDVEVGWQHSCALTESGRVYCWGSNLGGQLGLGFQGQLIYSSSTPLRVPGLENILLLGVAAVETCVLSAASGDIYCWGPNWSERVAAPVVLPDFNP